MKNASRNEYYNFHKLIKNIFLDPFFMQFYATKSSDKPAANIDHVKCTYLIWFDYIREIV